MAILNGVKFGRKKALADEQVLVFRQERSEGLKVRELMTPFSLSKASVQLGMNDSSKLQREFEL